MKLCNRAQAFWRPCISFVCIPLVVNMKMTLKKIVLSLVIIFILSFYVSCREDDRIHSDF